MFFLGRWFSWRLAVSALVMGFAFPAFACGFELRWRLAPGWWEEGVGDPWIWPEDWEDAFLPPGKEEYERAMKEGDAHMSAGRYKEAEGAYRKALSSVFRFKGFLP